MPLSIQPAAHNTLHGLRARLISFTEALVNLRLPDSELLYFDALAKHVPQFPDLFGYDLSVAEIEPIRTELFKLLRNPKKPFFLAVRHLLYRRTYHYLKKYKEDWPDGQTENFKMLFDFFKKFRLGLGPDVVRQYLRSLSKKKRGKYDLAPLYETFVDSELFTALLLWDGLVASGDLNSDSALDSWLTGKISDILTKQLPGGKHYLPKNLPIHEQIRDESNIFWGLSALYRAKGGRVCIGRYAGLDQFKDIVSGLARRESRQCPETNDLKYEITPELCTELKVNLYVLDNVLAILKHNEPDLGDEFKQDMLVPAERLVRECIVGHESTNLYFQCLQHRCLVKYLAVFAPPQSIPAGDESLIGFEDDYRYAVKDGQRVNREKLTDPQRALIKYCIEIKGRASSGDVPRLDYGQYILTQDRARMCPRLIDLFRSRPKVYDLLFHSERNQTYTFNF